MNLNETTPPFVAHDARFADIIGDAPQLLKVVDVDAHEGIVYIAAEDALYFTTLPHPVNEPLPKFKRVAIRRVQLSGDTFPISAESISTIRYPSNMANGMALDRDGNLIVCEQGTLSDYSAIGRINLKDGTHDIVVDEWHGLRFNSPNDVVVKSDGTIWFTDPSYGFLQGFKPAPTVGNYVYRYDPATNKLRVVDDSFNKPNGIAFSADERTLYITDSGANQEEGSYYPHLPHHIRAFDVGEGGALTNSRLFAVVTPGFPDGIKVDSKGNVYASSFGGVQVFDPFGEMLGEICLPNTINFTFGGAENNRLFITDDNAVWVAKLNAQGLVPHKS